MDEAQAGEQSLRGLSFLQLASTLVDTQTERKEKEAEAKNLKAREADIKTVLIDRMQKGEAPSIKVKGKTVYLHRSVWASIAYPEEMPAEARTEFKDRAYQALKEAGAEHLVYETVNQQSVSAYMRNDLGEDEQTGKPVWPPELEPLWKSTEQFDVRIRKA